MKFLNKLFEIYIGASIHVALAVYSLVRITEFYLKLPYNENLDYFIFYGTITGYNFVKHIHLVQKINSLSIHLKITLAISIITAMATFFYANKITKINLLFSIPLALLTTTYAIPVFCKKKLRNIPTLKILIIALVWASVTVLLPTVNTKEFFSEKMLFIFIEHFLFIIALTIPFDIRDFKSDKKNLQTLPQLIGIKKTKKLGFIILTLTVLIEFFITPNQSSKTIFIFIFFLTLSMIQKASINQKKYYSSFFVEAIPILWLLLLYFFKVSNETL